MGKGRGGGGGGGGGGVLSNDKKTFFGHSYQKYVKLSINIINQTYCQFVCIGFSPLVYTLHNFTSQVMWFGN